MPEKPGGPKSFTHSKVVKNIFNKTQPTNGLLIELIKSEEEIKPAAYKNCPGYVLARAYKNCQPGCELVRVNFTPLYYFNFRETLLTRQNQANNAVHYGGVEGNSKLLCDPKIDPTVLFRGCGGHPTVAKFQDKWYVVYAIEKRKTPTIILHNITFPNWSSKVLDESFDKLFKDFNELSNL